MALRATLCRARFVFHRENDTTWFLQDMSFFDGDSDAPACAHAPFGLSFDETREQCSARLGEPGWTSLWMPVNVWRFGRVTLHVTFGENNKPSSVQCMAAPARDGAVV